MYNYVYSAFLGDIGRVSFFFFYTTSSSNSSICLSFSHQSVWVNWVTIESENKDKERGSDAEFALSSSGSHRHAVRNLTCCLCNTFLLKQDKCCSHPPWEQRCTILTLLRGSLHLFWVIMHIRVCFCHRDVNTSVQTTRCS